MIDSTQRNLPAIFKELTDLECLNETEIYSTTDGFFAVTATIADILDRCGITNLPGSQGKPLECKLFFDDWYLYSISNTVCSLFKMREQEYDAKQGRNADGDTPGVTVSFIAFDANALLDCLRDPTPQKRALLNEEINRVVARRGQRHNNALKEYFIRTEAQGAYLIAELYTQRIAFLTENGCLSVPERYAFAYQKRGLRSRVAQFIEENNKAAGKVICDHKKIYICDPLSPTAQEQLAILATHAGNTSFFSFAAEVQFHAKFLTRWARIPIPIIGTPYASAIRADMSIGYAEFAGPTPYYRSDSRIVKKQYSCHKNTQEIIG